MQPQLASTLQVLRQNLPALRSRYGVAQMGIFGSVARGDNRPESDIDILVEFDRPIGLKFITLAAELEALLDHRVDLIDSRLPEKLKAKIEQDLVYV